jgi:L-alanine-DL-glutamate epimerase-like enolase superfamily enzyme
MKITSLQTTCYRIPLPRTLSDSTHGSMSHFQLVTVQVRDQDGAEGLGYTYTPGRGGTAIRALIESDLAPSLVGQEGDDIEDHWNLMWRDLHFVGRGGIASFAISAVDIALWDLKARRHGVPLWQLLEGTDHRVPVYGSGVDLDFSLDELLQQAESFLEQGFRAIKMKVGHPVLQTDLDRVGAMRELLGTEVPLMVDANMAWTVEQAIEAARALQPFNIYWLEEPTAPDDFPGHARVAKEGGLPIAAGENLHTQREFEMLIASQGVAFPEPDVANVGGVTSWLKIATMAEQAGLPVTSHGVHNLHVHLLAATRNASYLEYHGFGLERFTSHRLTIDDGYAIAPDRPGHGVELNWETLEPFREG